MARRHIENCHSTRADLGPCKTDNEAQCSDLVKFYDFSIDDIEEKTSNASSSFTGNSITRCLHWHIVQMPNASIKRVHRKCAVANSSGLLKKRIKGARHRPKIFHAPQHAAVPVKIREINT